VNEVNRLLFVGDTVPNKSFALGRSLKELCGEHDVRVFNLEGAFSRFRKPIFKAGSYLLLEPKFFEALTDCFNVATLANNHVMDFGAEGLDATIEQCKKAGISTVGAGLNLGAAFLPLETGNCRIISVAEREFGAAGKDKAGIATVDKSNKIYETIKQGRQSGKFVVVVAYGGTELIPIPPPYLRDRYKLWIDYGADLIIGSHPHVVQGFEWYKDKAIFYSLGNFIFFDGAFKDYPNSQWSIAVSVDISNNNIRTIPVCSDENDVIDIAADRRYEEEFKRLCNLIQSDSYFEHYKQIANKLYKSWYPGLSTTSREDAALLLNCLRCDAHRNLIQNSLSQKIGEIETTDGVDAENDFEFCDMANKGSSGVFVQRKICDSGNSSLLTIESVDGNFIEFPKLPFENSAVPEVPTELNEIIQDVHKWNNPRLVYLASADQWLGFEAFFKKNHLMQCDVFYCAIGGLGGLNLLPYLDRVEKIVFYDVNIYAARIADLQFQLIRYCSSVDEYISLIYQRPFDSSKYNFDNQGDFLQLPVNAKYNQKLREILTPQAYETYRYFYFPYILKLPSLLYDGPTIHCTHLLPFFESNKLTDSVVSGPFSNSSVNVNTFYVGKGWLSSDETFLAVRSHLSNSKLEVLIGDIAKVRPAGKCPGIYTTNIYSTHPEFDGYKRFIHLFRWMIGYDDNTDYEVQYYVNDKTEGMVEYNKLIGAGNGNPHATCCQAIDNLLDLHNNQFLEVIEPHPTEGMNYGFQYYRGQKRISVKDYLKTTVTGEQIIAVHILLGSGVSHQVWKNVCRKAVRESNHYVLIFDHRKECTDWPEWDVHTDNLLPHKKLDQFIYSLDHRWEKYGMPNVKGDINDIRNIMYFLEKSGQSDIYQTSPETNHAETEESPFTARQLFKSGLTELRSSNSRQALDYFNRACGLWPDMPDIHFALATAYAQLGDVYSAKKACETELTLQPGNDSAKQLLKRIEKAINESKTTGVCSQGQKNIIFTAGE